MSMPSYDGSGDSGIGPAVLLELGKMSKDIAMVQRDVAVVISQTQIIPDLEKRVRDVELDQAKDSGAKDWQARVVAFIAVLAAVAAIVAPFFHR